MDDKKSWGYLAAIGAVLIWGSAYCLKGEVVKVLSPIEISFWQTLGPVLFFGMYHIWKKHEWKVEKAQAISLILSGCLGITTYQVLNNIAIGMVGGVISSVFSGLVPIICILIEVVVLKNPFGVWKLLGVLFSFFGVILVVSGGGVGEFHFSGYLLLLLSIVVWVFYCYYNYNKRVHTNISSSAVLFYQFLGASITLSPYYLFQPFRFFVFLDGDLVWSLVFLGLINGFLAYVLFNFAIGKLGVFTVNIINNFIPIVALAINFIYFKEDITILQTVGTVLVVCAVLLSQKNPEGTPKQETAVSNEL